MSNVIKVDFSEKENRGYIMDGSKVNGIYHGELAATNNDGFCYIGKGCNNEILNSICMDTEDLNEFCIMWLAIFDPDALKFDEEK